MRFDAAMHDKSIRVGFGLILMLLALPLRAQDEWPEPEGPLSQRLCMTCHGSFGQGSPVVGGPNLAGMESWYLRRQLQNFAGKLRGTQEDYVSGYEMREAIAALSADEIDTVVAELIAWQTADTPATLDGDEARGAALYESCAACHGNSAEGNQLLGAPALATRNDWYLLKQLKLFKSGYRGSHPDDTFGAQMRAVMGSLENETDMSDVLAYIDTLGTAPPL